MTANDSPSRAASDAELVRYLDGELSSDDKARVEAVIASDADVASRLKTLRVRADRLKTLLADADPSAEATEAADPTRRAGIRSITSRRRSDRATGAFILRSAVPANSWLRAAAVIAALLGAAMLVPAVRAWIVDQLQTLTSGGQAVDMPSPVQSDPTPDPLGGALPAPGPVFDVELDNRPATGTLTIRAGAGTDAHYVIESQAEGGGALVLPDGLRFQNRAGSTSDYSITLPPSITTVRIYIDGRVVRTLEVSPADSTGIEIDLAAERPVGSD